jgi:hypothetical protein
LKQERYRILSISALILLVAVSAAAAGAPEHRPIFGSYTVLSAVDAGKGLTHVTLKIRLVNSTAETLSVQKISPWDEPQTETRHRTVLDLAAHSSGETTREFTVANYEYRHWLRSGRMVLHVTSAGPDGRARIVPAQLTRISATGVN